MRHVLLRAAVHITPPRTDTLNRWIGAGRSFILIGSCIFWADFFDLSCFALELILIDTPTVMDIAYVLCTIEMGKWDLRAEVKRNSAKV